MVVVSLFNVRPIYCVGSVFGHVFVMHNLVSFLDCQPYRRGRGSFTCICLPDA